jgi:predicted nuclease of predicted toxin-antitoxin system
VKLLFDENLSPKLVGLLRESFPGSAHVRDLGLRGAPDTVVWEHARAHGFTIVSKDDDFRQRSYVHGAPPRVVWLQAGNAGTRVLASLLREKAARLLAFEGEEESAILVVRLTT